MTLPPVWRILSSNGSLIDCVLGPIVELNGRSFSSACLENERSWSLLLRLTTFLTSVTPYFFPTGKSGMNPSIDFGLDPGPSGALSTVRTSCSKALPLALFAHTRFAFSYQASGSSLFTAGPFRYLSYRH